MIQKCPAIGSVERPALTVNHASRYMLLCWNIPQFLETHTVNLRLAIGVERILRLQQFGQVSAHALGEKGVFRVQLHSRHIIGFVGAISRDAHVARCDAFDRSVQVIKNFSRRKTWKYLDAKIFRLPGQPAA